MSQEGSTEHNLTVLFWWDFKKEISEIHFLIQKSATPVEHHPQNNPVVLLLLSGEL